MNNFKKIIVSAALLLIITSPVSGGDHGPIGIKDWKILYSQDNVLAPGTQIRQWESIAIPSTFRLPYPPEKKFQYAWLKGEFTINGDPSQYYGIWLGRVYHTDRVYINNVLIGSQNPESYNALHAPRGYIIPSGILKQGRNEFLVYIGIFGYEYGGIVSDVLVQNEKDFKKNQIWNNFLYVQIPFGIMLFHFCILLLCIIAFLIFITQKNIRDSIKETIIFILILSGLLFFIIFIYSLFFPYKPFQYQYTFFIQLAVIPAIIILMILFIQSLYGAYLPWYNEIVLPILFLIGLSYLANRLTIHNANIDSLLIWLATLLSIPCLSFLIYRLHMIKPGAFNLLMTILLIAVTESFILWEVAAYFSGTCNSGILVTYGSPIIIIIFMILYSREAVRVWIKTDHLYYKLKLYVENEKPARPGDAPSITISAEEKLKKIIEFIKDNYTSDMSREGLAAAVELNPSYMSRLFRAYTGKKVNEYINHLRIQESLNMLEDDNNKILDIALSVGFESLPTFNRIFKKITGKTPTEYRSEKKQS